MRKYMLRWFLCRQNWRYNEFCCYKECRYKEGSLYNVLMLMTLCCSMLIMVHWHWYSDVQIFMPLHFFNVDDCALLLWCFNVDGSASALILCHHVVLMVSAPARVWIGQGANVRKGHFMPWKGHFIPCNDKMGNVVRGFPTYMGWYGGGSR